MSSHEAHVRDIAGWDPTGVNDMTTDYRNLINQAALDGVPVVGDAFRALITETIILPPGHVFKGMRSGGDGGRSASLSTSELASSTFVLEHTGVGFERPYGGTGTASNRFKEGLLIQDMATERVQPEVLLNEDWTPADADFDFLIDDMADVHFERVHLRSATNGIKANGDRHTYKSITGTFFDNAFTCDWAYDILRLEDWHVWRYFDAYEEKIRAYQAANLDVFKFGRVDGPMLNRLFAIENRRFISIGYYNDPNDPGTTNKLLATDLYADKCATAYYVAPEAVGHSGHISGFFSQGFDGTASDDPAIDIRADDVVLQIKGFQRARNGASTISVTGEDVQLSTDVEIYEYGLNTHSPVPAVIHVQEASSRVDILPGSRVLNTASRPNSLTEGRVSGVGIYTVNPAVTATGPGLPATTATLIYTLSNDDYVDFSITISTPSIGSATGSLQLTLPYAAAASSVFIGREVAVTGQSVSAFVAGSADQLYIQDDDNNFPAAAGAIILISGRYRTLS